MTTSASTPIRPLVTVDKTVVTPQLVYAAGHDSFTAIVRGDDNPAMAKVYLFNRLPLAESGWVFDTAKISRAGKTWDGHPIWKLERGQ